MQAGGRAGWLTLAVVILTTCRTVANCDTLDGDVWRRVEVGHPAHHQQSPEANTLQRAARMRHKHLAAGATFKTTTEPEHFRAQQVHQLDAWSHSYLDTSSPSRVQAYQNKSATLSCRLRSGQLNEHLQVSWFKDIQLLTSGEFSITSDTRFEPSHRANTNDWMLKIQQVRSEDQGFYECQVNAEPRPARLSVYLEVLTPRLEILEGSEVRVDEGHQVTLTCRLHLGLSTDANHQDSGEAQADDEYNSNNNNNQLHVSGPQHSQLQHPHNQQQEFIYWYKNGQVMSQNQVRRKGYHENKLIIKKARNSDQATYTCQSLSEIAQPAETLLLVGSGSSKPVSMAASCASPRYISTILPLLPILFAVT